MWKSSGNAGFPSSVERVENSLWEFSALSTRRHFHGALQLDVLKAKGRRLLVLPDV
jgi:hypothetical protein